MENKDLQIRIGERIRKILKDKGLKQQYLVDNAGFTKSYVSLLLSGKINVTAETIDLLEKALETKLFPPVKRVGLLKHVSYHGNDCIYLRTCDNPVGDSEHIFNSGWGGIAEEKDITCRECNNGTSSDLDTSFDPIVQRIKNAKAIVTPRKKNPPPVKLGDGRKLGKHAQLKIPGATHVDSFEAGIDDTFDYDLDLQYRAAAHTCLKALAYFTPELARNNLFNGVKDYIKCKSGEMSDFAVDVEIDDMFLPTRGQFIRGEFNHVLLYFSKRLGKVIGAFHLLGVIKRAVVLSEEWDGDEMVIIVDEHLGKDIRGRVWEFMEIDETTPDIMRLSKLSDDTAFKEREVVWIKQWRAAIDLSSKLTSHLEMLDANKITLTQPELDTIRRIAVELWGALLHRSGNHTPEADIINKAETFGLNELLAAAEGKYMSISFAIELTSIGERLLTSYDENLKNIE